MYNSIGIKHLEWTVCKALGNRRKIIALDCFGNEFCRIDLPMETKSIIKKMKEAQQRYDDCILSSVSAPSVCDNSTAAPDAIHAGWNPPTQTTDALLDKYPHQDEIERIILRRVRENRVDGFTLEMAREIAAIGAGGQAVADDPVSFQWKTIDGWVECSISGSAHQRREYAQSMARSVGLGYRELYNHPADERVVEALRAKVEEIIAKEGRS